MGAPGLRQSPVAGHTPFIHITMMLRLLISTTLLTAAGLSTRAAAAQSITLSSAPATLVVRTATPGAEPEAAVDMTTSYDLVTTAAGQRVVARLEDPLPAGLSLSIEVVAPPGAASSGRVPLGMLDREIMGAVPVPGEYSGLRITYRLTAATEAGTVPPSIGRVVLTVVDATGRAVTLR